MNEVNSNSASHNKVVPDSMFCNEWIHLKFYIHKSSLIINSYINEDIGRSF